MGQCHYWCFRLLRRAMPSRVVNFLLDHNVLIKPGCGTHEPAESAKVIADRLAAMGRSLTDASVMVAGYGGSCGLGLHLLEAGAKHVVLQDPFAAPRQHHLRQLPAELLARWGIETPSGWTPDPERLTITRQPLPEYADEHPASVDMVTTNSVLEHVRDPEPFIAAAAKVGRKDSFHLHGIDLRDHFFRYPFEMLCYSQKTWEGWLDASNHLNRLRLRDFREMFEQHFTDAKLSIAIPLPKEFAAIKSRIRPEFLSGNDEEDAAGAIVVEASCVRDEVESREAQA